MYGFIVNKTAGSGKGHTTWKQIERALETKKEPYLMSFTETSRDAVRRTNELLESGVKAVVVVGGDGTVSEAAEALVHTSIPLGIIPAGSGNDIARSLGIPGNVSQALSRVFAGNPKKIDVLQLGDRYCLTVAGIGFDGEVAKTVNEASFKKWLNVLKLGRLVYTASVFRVLTSFKPVDVTLTIDGSKQQFSDVWLTAVANAPNYGGNIRICPEAVNDDGCLDICVLHSTHKWPLLRQLPNIFSGKHSANEHISFLKGKKILVEADVPLLVQSDGEVVGETPVEVEVAAKALLVL